MLFTNSTAISEPVGCYRSFYGSAGLGHLERFVIFHERGSFRAMYVNVIAGGDTIGPPVRGFTVTHLAW